LAPERFPLARVAGLGPPWDESEAPPASSGDAVEVRRAAWERPGDPGAQLALAALEASEGRPALARHALERAWALAVAGGELAEAWYLSAARLWGWVGDPGLAREALERAIAAAPLASRAHALLGADQLATLRYADAAESFRAAASAVAEPDCPVLLGLALTAVAVASGDPAAFPAAPLETYLARCADPDPLALLWLARHRAAD
jgi:tetratricopeptide (TPR) repeat protein